MLEGLKRCGLRSVVYRVGGAGHMQAAGRRPLHPTPEPPRPISSHAARQACEARRMTWRRTLHAAAAASTANPPRRAFRMSPLVAHPEDLAFASREPRDNLRTHRTPASLPFRGRRALPSVMVLMHPPMGGRARRARARAPARARARGARTWAGASHMGGRVACEWACGVRARPRAQGRADACIRAPSRRVGA